VYTLVTPNTQLLNLGCGHRYHNEWTNIDFRSTGKGVIGYNLLKGIPFKNETFDMVYHSNVIEHFSKEDAPKFLKECYRVLKPEGIIRVVFPDLEQIVNHYTRLLKELRDNNLQREPDYDWIMLELYDQTVRNFSGGEMFKYFIRESIPNEKFVLERCGVEAKNLLKAGKLQYTGVGHKNNIEKKNLIDILKYLRRKMLVSVHKTNEKIWGKRYAAFKIGQFRLGGEIHQWMYDTYSLGRLLNSIGFKQIVVQRASTSYLDGWKKYDLDTEPDGSIYKPDSNYIEAKK
jgi:predicted SAM-dependent methyltransferase